MAPLSYSRSLPPASSQYLTSHPDADRPKLLKDVASGLHYLHTLPNPVVHGDIYLDNVLVSFTERAMLNDFGLSSVLSADASPLPSLGYSASYLMGRASYEAPERHDGARRSCATDVFAFATLIFHAYSGAPPFAALCNQAAVILAIHSGACWSHNPGQRPAIADVGARLRALR
ncbi:kinase-like protein [Auricularia subglabra TFB-10046 SS5]|nr:kinase-like protein [Auricularia subglabra TFB-10046 SS5]